MAGKHLPSVVPPREGTLYPDPHPPGTRVLVRASGSELTLLDRTMVVCSSLFIVGSVAWVPFAYAWLWRRWSRIPKRHKRRRMWCAALLAALAAFVAIAPYKHRKVGDFLKVRSWRLWEIWSRFVALEVVADSKRQLDANKQQAVVAIIPHGIFPFSLALVAISDMAGKGLAYLRPIVASATNFVPILRTFLGWLGCIDATRSAVDEALSTSKESVGLVPGGIAEMFLGYPKPGTHPDEEYAMVRSRKGFVRMAVKHGLPIVPVYCFGATKMFRRLQLGFLENLSNALRIGVCLFYGVCGLPIPFRQRLLYVTGEPMYPSTFSGTGVLQGEAFEQEVDALHEKFCDEIMRLFERHKHSYGWSRKVLKLV